MVEAVFQGNTAAQSAQGVYNAGTLYTQGLRELSNGLYIENRDAVAYLTDALAESTVLQLENSSHVAPNPAGTPIVVGEATPQYPRLSQADADGFQKPLAGFDGWEIRLSEDSTQVLLAPVVYTLRYENTMGGQNPNPSDYTVSTPTITLLPLADTPGDHFLGWFDAPEGGTQVTEIPLGSTGDKTLYARWETIEYTVTYYGNAAGAPAAENVPQPQRVQGGGRVLLSDMRPTRTGYLFAGWNTEPNGSGVSYQPDEPFGPVFADAGLYAQWTALPPIMHTLSYCGNDAGGPHAFGVPCPGQVPAGQYTLISHCVPHRARYCFTAWNTDPCGRGQMVCPGQSFGPVTGDVCLYAQWKQLPPPEPGCNCRSESD